MRALGIDYGSKRIGLAVSDETFTIARELTILSPKEFWIQIPQIIAEQEIDRIILGLPTNMSGGETEVTRQVQEFADRLEEQLHLPVEYVDERLSSQMAEQISGKKSGIDSLSAQIILQNYLDQTK